MGLLVALLLAQASQTVIVDPTVQSLRAKVVSTSGGAIQVSCVGGTCTGGGASSGGGDGGYTVVIQGPGGDGGQAWGVTGTVTVAQLPVFFLQDAGVLNVQGPVTDTQLRASAVPVSVANLDVALSTRTKPADQQHTIIDSSASIAVTGPLTDTQLRASVVPVYVDGGTILATQGTSPWTVSGTVTTTPPSNASTNVAQFGGTNVSTGTGTGGAGIPRVTISSDSSLAANQSVNLNQVAGAGVATGNGTAAGSVRVSIASDTTGVVAATQSGTWTDRIVGNAGAAFDAVNNAAAPANVLAVGFEVATQGTTQPTAATAGNVRRNLVDGAGVQYTHPHGPVSWSCFVQAVTATTQCRAAPAAGLRAYVNTVVCDNQAATVQTIDVVFGTGAACVTGTTALTHKFQMGTNATTTSPDHVQGYFPTPLVPTAANAICVRPSAATAFGCTLTGYDAQ